MLQVLVVEDEALVADDLQRTLTRLGYAVPVTVASGQAAIDTARALRPAVVLMDIKLRGAMDGVEAAARIKRELEIPVIFLTSHSDESTLARAKEVSPQGYLAGRSVGSKGVGPRAGHRKGNRRVARRTRLGGEHARCGNDLLLHASFSTAGGMISG